MSLSGDQLWVQLNYQLIHLLDFLPVAHWGDNADDMFLQQFVRGYGPACSNHEAFGGVMLSTLIDGLID